ncbi:MAG: hypothetical protein ACOH5I_06805 [Oligoflexus sp.]
MPWRIWPLAMILLIWSQPSEAFVSYLWQYLQQYQLGIEYSQSFDRVRLEYATDLDLSERDDCVFSEDNPDELRCRIDMQAGQSSGYGIFLSQAFERQGDFHLTFDLGFNIRYLDGVLAKERSELLQENGLPLNKASFSLVSLIALPYIQFGYTPLTRFPDILVSIGPAFQTALGQVQINDEKRDVVVALTSGVIGYVELELVLWRFGKGAFSLYAAMDKAGNESTPFFPEDLQHIEDIQAEFQRGTGGQFNGFGAKLLLSWP